MKNKLIFMFLGIFFIGSVFSISINDFNPSSITTSNSSYLFNYNFSTDYLNNLTWQFDGVNYTIYDPSLVLFYNFDNRSAIGENDTFVRDLSIYGKNGTVQNMNWIAGYGRMNTGGFNFTENTSSGAIKDIYYNQVLANNSNFTISVWLKPFNYSYSDTSGGVVVKFIGDYNWMRWQKTWNGRCFVGGTNSSSSSDWDTVGGKLKNFTQYVNQVGNCPVGFWANAVITNSVNGNYSNLTFYVNGIMQSNGIASGILRSGSTTSTIGGSPIYPQTNYLAFNGSIDDLMIWNRTLSPSEVKNLYSVQLIKYNNSDWNININQSLNATINSTNPSYIYNYQLIVSNLTNSVYSSFSYILDNINIVNLFIDTINSLGNINNYFYGANTHGNFLTITNSKYLEHRSNWTNANLNYARWDMSLDSYYEGLVNLGFEDWYNISMTNASGNIEGPYGWGVNWQYSNGSVYRVTDVHSGNYAIQINSTTPGQAVYLDKGDGINWISFENGTSYNLSIWAKGNASMYLNMQREEGSYLDCFVDATTGTGGSVITLTNAWKLYSATCNFTNSHNLTNPSVSYDNYESPVKYRFTLDCYGNCTIDDFNITRNGVQYNYWRKGNLSDKLDQMAWYNKNNYKALLIESYTPQFLAKATTECNYTVGIKDYSSCAPLDYNILGNITVDYINRVTNNGQYKDNVEVEVWNEPYYTFLLDNSTFDSMNRTYEYFRIYNASYNAIKGAYSTIPVGGPCGYYTAPNMMNGFLSNFSNKMDFVSMHPYMNNYELSDGMLNKTNWLVSLCNLYNANCSRIIMSEWQPTDQTLKNTTANWTRYSMNIALAYSDLLNNFASKITSVLYQWSDSVAYGVGYPEYPSLWYMFSQSNLDNRVTPPYNVTKSFSSYCSVGSSVINSTSDDILVKIVTCRSGNNYNFIIINTDTNSRNVSINNLPDGSLIDSNGNNYPINSGTSQIGILDSYAIDYLNYNAQIIPIINPIGTGFNNYSSSDSSVCQIVYNFILDHYNAKLIYTEYDLTVLETKLGFTRIQVINYLNNYPSLCTSYKPLPFSSYNPNILVNGTSNINDINNMTEIKDLREKIIDSFDSLFKNPINFLFFLMAILVIALIFIYKPWSKNGHNELYGKSNMEK